MNNNGCNEDGWDLYEDQTREEFEFYAVRKGYSLEKDRIWYRIWYTDTRTQDAWEMYHKGHIMGRGWKR